MEETVTSDALKPSNNASKPSEALDPLTSSSSKGYDSPRATNQCPEQPLREVRKLELFNQSCTLLLVLCNLIVAFGVYWQISKSAEDSKLVMQQLATMRQQVEQNNDEMGLIAKQNRVASQGVLYSHATELSKAFMADGYVEFTKYFYSGDDGVAADLPNEVDEDFRARLDLLCELHTDLMENVLQHMDILDPNDAASWRTYIQNVYSRSPVMRDFLRRYRSSYTSNLWTVSQVEKITQNKGH